MQNTPRKPATVKQVTPPTLPSFGRKRMDFGTWTYVHRAGICMTVIVFLLFAIAFMTMKITMASLSSVAVIELEMEIPPEILAQPVDETLPDDRSRVMNRISNEGGGTDNRRRGGGGGGSAASGGVNAALGDQGDAELLNMAGRLGGQLGANRSAYEAGLRQVGEMSNRRDDASAGRDDRNSDEKVSGTVTVSYSFLNPVRNREVLVVPAYMCEGGGTVVVDATLDRNGFVISAVVNRTSSSADDCMKSTAVKAALESRFNIDVSAPAKHRGTIRYEFMAQ